MHSLSNKNNISSDINPEIITEQGKQIAKKIAVEKKSDDVPRIDKQNGFSFSAKECLNCGLVQSAEHGECMICQGPLKPVDNSGNQENGFSEMELVSTSDQDEFSLTICPNCQFTVFGSSENCENCGHKL
ncbi:hypothetical protein ACFL35_19040 [Candidatus Riflebacteria bacterium]